MYALRRPIYSKLLKLSILIKDFFRTQSYIKGLTTKSHKLFSQKALSYRSCHPEVFLGKGVLKICSRLTEDTYAEVRFQ